MKDLIYGFWMLVGTYTGGESEGIYVYGFDPETGQTEYVGMASVDNPSYMTASTDGSMVWAVSENGSEKPSLVNAFEFDAATGALRLVDSAETTGAAPCNITTDGRMVHSGRAFWPVRNVVTANYLGGDISIFKRQPDNSLLPYREPLRLPSNGTESHMHCVKFSPDGKYLFAADLGTDKIVRWRVRRGRIYRESLVTFDVPAGSGPRHFIFDGAGKNLYLINEYSGTVIAFRYNGGYLEHLQTVQADTAGGGGSADILLTPDGRWLYASNRLKNDGVAIFAVNPENGTLTPAGYRTTGIHPRNLSISPGGKFLLAACRDSDAIEVFEIDHTSGALTPTDRTVGLDSPVCVVFIPAAL